MPPSILIFLVISCVGFVCGNKDKEIRLAPTQQYAPGDTVNTVDEEEIDKILTDLVSNNGGTHIRAGIGIAAQSHALSNPRFVLKDGASNFPLPKRIPPGHTGLILFHKYLIGVKGIHGVVTYDIEGTDVLLAVLVSIPENSLLYNSYFNIKYYYHGIPVNGKLVEQMYEYAAPWSPGRRGERKEYGVQASGTMSEEPRNKRNIFVLVDASTYNIREGPTRYAECDFKATALGDRCWRECTPTGWCWTNEHCDYDSDCNGNMFCNGACNKV